jgi:hypothetical protein
MEGNFILRLDHVGHGHGHGLFILATYHEGNERTAAVTATDYVF